MHHVPTDDGLLHSLFCRRGLRSATVCGGRRGDTRPHPWRQRREQCPPRRHHRLPGPRQRARLLPHAVADTREIREPHPECRRGEGHDIPHFKTHGTARSDGLRPRQGRGRTEGAEAPAAHQEDRSPAGRRRPLCRLRHPGPHRQAHQASQGQEEGEVREDAGGLLIFSSRALNFPVLRASKPQL